MSVGMSVRGVCMRTSSDASRVVVRVKYSTHQAIVSVCAERLLRRRRRHHRRVGGLLRVL